MQTYALDDISQWTFGAAAAMCPPTIQDEVLYVGCRDNHLYAIDTATGELQWTFEADHTVYSPAVSTGAVYAGSYDNSLYSIDRNTGEGQWSTEANSTLFAPQLNGEFVYVGAYNGCLYCIDTSTGSIEWRFQGDGPMSVKTTPEVADGMVYAGSDDEHLYIVSESAGRQKQNLNMCGSVRTLTQLNGFMYAGATNGAIQAIETGTGETAWLQQFEEAIRTLTSRDESVIVGSAGRVVFCVEADSGTLCWDYSTGAVVQSIATDHKFVYAATDNQTIHAIDHRGECSFTIETSKPIESLCLATETLYATDEGGTLHMISLAAFDEWSPEGNVDGDEPGFVGYSLTTDAWPSEAVGYYIVLDRNDGLDSYVDALNQLDTAAREVVLIVDGNNTSIHTTKIKTEATNRIDRVTVRDCRREQLEAELEALSYTAATHSLNHIDGTKELPEWLTSSHYFRHLTSPESHPQCPRLFVCGLQRYYKMSRTDGKQSWHLYDFVKNRSSNDEIPYKKNFIFGMLDLISRRVLRAPTSYDSIIPIPGHDGGISKPLKLTTKMVAKTTPIDRHHVLTRINTTTQQKSLTDIEARYDNVEGSFGVKGDLNGQRVLLIDDICTSGASLSYAAKALFEAGATEVVGIVYGFTVGGKRIRDIDGPGATITDMQLVYGEEI